MICPNAQSEFCPRASLPARLFWLSLFWTTTPVQAAFYQEGTNQWGYRAPITVESTSARGSTIILDIDFADLIAQTSAPGTLDINSIRVVKNDTILIGEQEFNDSVYQGVSDATGNFRGELRFILEDAPGIVNHHVYFDITDNGTKPVSPAPVINGTFEQATGNPTRWSRSSLSAGGAQNNESYSSLINSTAFVPTGCTTSSANVDNSPSNNGTEATGRGWHLLGYRDNCEDGGTGNERIRLTRSIRVPAGAAAGTLDFAFQVQAWDGISDANNYDWFSVAINNTAIDHLNMGVTAGTPALVLEPSRFGRSAFGTALIDHGWRNASVDLSGFAGTTIALRFEARFSSADNSYRSWIKLDDVTWSAKRGKVGNPELDSVSVASFEITHDSNGIYCLGEPVRVRAIDASGNQIPDFAGSVTLDTQQSTGQFSLISGNGAFSASANGTASYTYVPTDLGEAAFLLNYPSGPTPIDIDVFLNSDSAIRDTDGEGPLTFSPSGFTFTATALGNPPSIPIDSTIPPQIAGTVFALHIAAYGETEDDPTCGVIETYTGARPLRFWQSYINPASGALQAAVNGNNIATNPASATSQTVSFTAGQASVSVQYPDVGAIAIGTTDSTSGSVAITGASDQFVVKPAALVISRIESSTGQPNPAASTLTGDGFVAAGEAFVVDVDAVNANNVLTPNFGLETPAERVAVRSEALVLPTGGINGSTGDVQNGGAFSPSATPGRSTNTSVAFDETGIISMRARLTDDDYMGSGDVSRPLVANVGRFYPARFELISGSVEASCATFTYMDEQALDLSYEIHALDTGGNLTTNYSDHLYGASATVDFQLTAENNDNGTDLSARLTALPNNWVSGILNTSSQIAFSRGATPDGPYSDLTFGARIIDALDSNLIDGADSAATVAGNCSATASCNAAQIGTSTAVLYGRALVLPAQGPETDPLPVGLEVQYFNGAEFQRNPADNCTAYESLSTVLSNYTENLQAGETTVFSPVASTLFSSGASLTSNPLKLSAPGAGNTGTVDLTFDTDEWLRFDWYGSGNVNPAATATFGGFRGHDRIIYWQERR